MVARVKKKLYKINGSEILVSSDRVLYLVDTRDIMDDYTIDYCIYFWKRHPTGYVLTYEKFGDGEHLEQKHIVCKSWEDLTQKKLEIHEALSSWRFEEKMKIDDRERN